jgi:hypothetical protein
MRKGQTYNQPCICNTDQGSQVIDNDTPSRKYRREYSYFMTTIRNFPHLLKITHLIS